MDDDKGKPAPKADLDWYNFPLDRLTHFRGSGRIVGSLAPGELVGLQAWLSKIDNHWASADDELRALYRAIHAKIAYDKAEHEAKTAPEFQIASAEQQNSESHQSVGIQIAPAPLTDKGRSQIREAELVPPTAPPMSKRTAVEQSEFVSDDVPAAEQQPVEHDSSEPEEELSGAPVEGQSLELMRGLNSDEVLKRLDEANAALDAASCLEEVKQIADIAVAAHVYAKRAKRGEAVQNNAAAYVCRALAKLGRMMSASRAAGKPQKKGRPEKRDRNRPFSDPGKPKTLAQLGIDKHQATQARKLAKFPEPEFESRLNEKLEKHELSRTSTLEDPKQRDPKPATRQDCVKALSKLVEVLADCGDESFDAAFLQSQKLDLDKYRAVWPKLMALMKAVGDFIQTPPPVQQSQETS
jgi:hypothetical protein